MLDRGLPPVDIPGAHHGIVVGPQLRDDAAVVRPIGAGRGLVLTCDVITPLVDDPHTFGRIAATNALSDVYAMGGVPRYALNLAFFPDKKLPLQVFEQVLAGAGEACAEAGVAVVGGHSVRDEEIKFGLSVTGEVDLQKIWSNRAAQPGQVLVLTKAVGTGLVAGARKRHAAGDIPEIVSEDDLAVAITSMTTLNEAARNIGSRHGVTAATDITGFGLLGHLGNIVAGSQVRALISLRRVPTLPGAMGAARHGVIPGGTRANLEYVQKTGVVEVEDSVSEARLWVAADAQTSGGLLLCVDADACDSLVAELQAQGQVAAAIGTLEAAADKRPGVIVVAR